jgi:hypothetical protein
MNPDEARRHNAKRQLTKAVGKLHKAASLLVKAEDHIQLIKNYSQTTQTGFENIDALRAGIEETQKILSQEIAAIECEMQEPSATPPPEKGAYLNNRQTPLQKILGVSVSNLPTRQTIPRTHKIPQIIEFNLTKPKRKPRSLRKHGAIPI